MDRILRGYPPHVVDGVTSFLFGNFTFHTQTEHILAGSLPQVKPGALPWNAAEHGFADRLQANMGIAADPLHTAQARVTSTKERRSRKRIGAVA